jgi:hypothetical protein
MFEFYTFVMNRVYLAAFEQNDGKFLPIFILNVQFIHTKRQREKERFFGYKHTNIWLYTLYTQPFNDK